MPPLQVMGSAAAHAALVEYYAKWPYEGKRRSVRLPTVKSRKMTKWLGPQAVVRSEIQLR